MPTGKEHDKFGKEFYVQFNETEQAFPLWFKEAPEIGKQIEGEISNGKFKKIRKEWTPGTDADPKTASRAKPAYKDNSDGMRQGMCINNAANYINTLEFEKALSDREWAETVHAYANALYRLGDLSMEAPEVQEAPKDDLSTVQEVFGPVQKVAAPRSVRGNWWNH